MIDPIVAADSQNEKPSINPVAGQALQYLTFKGDSRAAQSIDQSRSDRSVRSHSGGKSPNLWSFFLVLLIILGGFGLVPLLIMKPDRCGRFTFGLTLYRLGETRAEYDGQCDMNSKGDLN